MGIYFRWIKKPSADLAAAQQKELQYTHKGNVTDKAYWIFEKARNISLERGYDTERSWWPWSSIALGLSVLEVKKQTW